MLSPAELLCLVPFYLIGAFPTGHLIAKSKGIDIGNEGSGNVGASNVARVIGKKAGAMTLIGDAAKGFFPVWMSYALWSNLSFSCLCAIALVCGHCFSIPGKLKGGKGVATALGTMLYLATTTTLCALVVFIIVGKIWKISSLASIVATLSAPIFALLMNQNDEICFCLGVIALIVVFRHRENLQRLALGTEKKLQFNR